MNQPIPTYLKTLGFALLLSLATSIAANALPPMGQHRTGVIENIDHQTQHLTFRADRDEKPRVWVWNKRTRFVRGVHFVDAEAMRQGARAGVIQRTPFFGEPVVTKVVILSNGSASKSR